MAKKTVASLHEGSKEGRLHQGYQNGEISENWSLRFDEQMVANEKYKTF